MKLVADTLARQKTKLLLLGNLAYLEEMAKKYGNDCTIGDIIKAEKKENV